MKVFISHKQEDAYLARNVLYVLKQNKVDAYLDLLDDTITMSGEKLTQHIKNKLNECTDILVVLSEKTKESWWVPFEIGMAAQKDLPTVNYLLTGVVLPDILSYWPRLRNDSDLIKYINAREKVRQQVLNESVSEINKFSRTKTETEKFYSELRSQLG